MFYQDLQKNKFSNCFFILLFKNGVSRGKGKNKGFQLPSLSLDGLFNKGPKNKGNGAPRPSYGAPRPSYGAPQAPQAPRAPQGPPRPNYSSGSTDFGPSNAIKMLPAPNLATARPTVNI